MVDDIEDTVDMLVGNLGKEKVRKSEIVYLMGLGQWLRGWFGRDKVGKLADGLYQ